MGAWIGHQKYCLFHWSHRRNVNTHSDNAVELGYQNSARMELNPLFHTLADLVELDERPAEH